MTLQEIEQPTFTIDIVVGQIELRDPGAGQAQRVLCRIPGDQQVLDDPVDLGSYQGEVPRADRYEGPLPQVQDGFVDRVVQTFPVDELRGTFEVLVLDLQRTQLTTIRELDLLGAGHVVADFADSPDRVLERQIPHHHTGLDHPQHQIS